MIFEKELVKDPTGKAFSEPYTLTIAV